MVRSSGAVVAGFLAVLHARTARPYLSPSRRPLVRPIAIQTRSVCYSPAPRPSHVSNREHHRRARRSVLDIYIRSGSLVVGWRLQRAAFQWSNGDYVNALTTYEALLAGPDAAQVLDEIALQTGELYRSTELTTDGANPVFARDGKRFCTKPDRQ